MRAAPGCRRRRGLLAAMALTLLVAGCGATTPRGSTSSTSSSSSTTSSVPASIAPYLALWPFRSSDEVASWQQKYAADRSTPWHLDAGATALNFVRDFLRFQEVGTVVKTSLDATGAHVAVGYQPKEGVKATAAVVHLVRWGTGTVAPWEVVGTDDSSFRLTTPAYGAAASSPLQVGGTITGVDESINVGVRQPSSANAIGSFCCLAAGGTNSPWSVTVAYTGAADPVLTVVASTGGHVQTVERFAVTGVRRPGP